MMKTNVVVQSETVQVALTRPHAKAPSRGAAASEGAVAYDICSCEDVLIQPGERELLDTGVILRVPEGLCCRVVSLPGLALRGLDVVGPAVVDAASRGAVQVLLANNNNNNTATGGAHQVRAGDKVAQLVFERVAVPRLFVADWIDA